MPHTNNEHWSPDALTHADPQSLSPVWMQGIVQALALTVAIALGAYITHFPGIDLSESVAAGLLAGIMLVGLFMSGTGARTTQRAMILGAITGGLSALLATLIVFASAMVEQPTTGQSPAAGAEGLRQGAVGASAGFVLGAGVLGAVLAFIGNTLVKGPSRFIQTRAHWTTSTTPQRMAIVLAAAMVPLLATGGLVTSTRSGLAIPDWPSSDSAYMFFYPLSLMGQPNIYFEHTHRLFGTLVGIAALFAVVIALASNTSKKMRIGIVLALLLIVIQGVLGGERVNNPSQMLAAVHGILAQLIFALVVACVVWQSRTYRDTTPINTNRRDRKIKLFGAAFLHASILQLILGAAFRHLKASGSPGANHALYTHLGFSAIVLLFGIGVGALLVARSDTEKDRTQPIASAAGWWSIGFVSLQIVLGFVALFAVMKSLSGDGPGPIPDAEQVATMTQVPWKEAMITAAHQFNGALVLASAAVACVWGRWLYKNGKPADNA